MGAIVCENHDHLYGVIQRWMEKNAPYIEYVSPIEKGVDRRSHPGDVLRTGRPDADRAGATTGAAISPTRLPSCARSTIIANLTIVDILNAGCSKGHALERWATHRWLDRSQVMAIGDNYNDIEMLTFAGHPVIMGNASDDLKQNGWTITLHNDESGVAAAVEQILDPKPARSMRKTASVDVSSRAKRYQFYDAGSGT